MTQQNLAINQIQNINLLVKKNDIAIKIQI